MRGRSEVNGKELIETLKCCKDLLDYLKYNGSAGNIRVVVNKPVHEKSLKSLIKITDEKVNKSLKQIELVELRQARKRVYEL
jgi:hypothetical protein